MTTTVRQPEATAGPSPVPPPAPQKPAPDVRYLALRNFAMSISVFNIFGYTLLGFEQPWLWPIFAVLTSYTAELAFETVAAWAHRREPRYRGRGGRGLYEFLLPSHITALAVNMLLYANNQFWPIAFGVAVGVGAKYVLQAPIAGRTRHYMNPSNFGIAVTLVVFSSWVSLAPPYEFTENANTFWRVMIPIIIITAGTTINGLLTKRVLLIVGWLGGFAIQAFVRHWIFDVSLYGALGVMTGVAFVLFTNYMITDPGTTPMRGRNQFMFGASVATVYGVLMVFDIVYAIFFATAIVCLIRGLGWQVVTARRVRGERRAADIRENILSAGRRDPEPVGRRDGAGEERS
ncbi:enediyne biosynthesis protein [Umezawaea sp. Da 62-37]|uniref:enediyne biosynthesis protein n=1 Tax=Umezawaea sp. Da 62-37 TaxID=3075927 RepID=UPI0028F724ED|nr:enediyne biosynthesis protein [Umezawaea sp. Da 62-37]WNV84566.1 enediyne biosynthesis protein [Umezawaea sp. Da 62-37]